jgi:hypothetical protein
MSPLLSILKSGALLNLGYYCIGNMQHLINEVPRVVSASSQWVIKNDVELWTTGVLHYPSGTTGAFSCGFLSPFEISYELLEPREVLIFHMAAWSYGLVRISKYAYKTARA